MRMGLRRAAMVAVVAICSAATIGCSGDDESQGDDSPSVDEVAQSWGEVDPRDEQRARSYLAGRGRPLMEYVDFVASLDERLDEAAYDDKCADLRAEWTKSYGGRDILDWLYALPDPILGRLWTSQIPSVASALQACAGGDRNASTEAAEQVARVQELVDRRLDQLGVGQ